MGYNDNNAFNYDGLDSSKIKISNTPGQWNRAGLGANNFGGDWQISADEVRQTYNGPGGEWVKTGTRFGNDDYKWGAGWTNASGKVVSDLGGYLKKGSLQQTGSDFSDYENQLRGLMSDPSKIQQTAGSQFAQKQGEQAINRSAAARGQLGGGGVLAELAKYGQGLASQDYGEQVARLSSLIGQKQQFGLASGYYDDLRNQKPSGGGGVVRASAPPPAAPRVSLGGIGQDEATWAETQRSMDAHSAELAAKEAADAAEMYQRRRYRIS